MLKTIIEKLKRNRIMTWMVIWLNRSVVTINVTLQLIYIYIYIDVYRNRKCLPPELFFYSDGSKKKLIDK